MFEIIKPTSARESWEGPLPPETNEAYHARKGYLSSSELKQRIPSAYNFAKMVLTPPERTPSEALDFGSAVHEVLLTDDFSQFVVMPDFDSITEMVELKSGPNKGQMKEKVIKSKKAQVEEFEAENAGRRILTANQMGRLQAMVSYAMSKPAILGYLKHPKARFEQGYLYKDPYTDEPCKYRTDIEVDAEEFVILDYKTCEDASPHAFAKSIARYHYPLSEAHYITGSERVHGRKVDKYIYIAQQKTYPFSVATYQISMISRSRAFSMRKDLLALIQKNRKDNYYPDFVDRGIITLEVPGYAFEIGEERT